MLTIVPVVEGDGDARAAPLLLRRILAEYLNSPGAVGRPVVAHGRQNLEGNLATFLDYAQGQRECGAILVLVDADDDCPVQIAQAMRTKADNAGISVPVQIVYANRMYESWFLASLTTVMPSAEVSDAVVSDTDTIQNPKSLLNNLLQRRRGYKETRDQVAFTSRVDITLAHSRSRSFRRLCHAVEQLLAAADESA